MFDPEFLRMMMSRGGIRFGSSMFAVLGPRYFSTATVLTFSNEGISDWMRAPTVGVRCRSTLALGDKEQEEKQALGGGPSKDEKGIVSYWSLQPTKVTKEDGAEWKWTCFKVQNLFILIICLFLLVT